MSRYILPNFGPRFPVPPRDLHLQGLYWRIVNQVNYYFRYKRIYTVNLKIKTYGKNNIFDKLNYSCSDKNLETDTFLKGNMDEDGWVSIKLIATFRNVSEILCLYIFVTF